MSLYQITNDFINAMNEMEFSEDGNLGGIEKLDAIAGDFRDKAESIACYIKDLNADADALKTEINNLKTRADSKARKAESLKRYLFGCMEAVECPKLETSRCIISFRKSTSVNIVNEEELPEKYITTAITYKPDRMAIKKAIQAGQTVTGAELVESKNLQIK